MHFTAHDELSLFYLLLALGALLVAAAMRRLPVPVLLVCGGLLLGFVPGLPHVELPPDLRQRSPYTILGSLILVLDRGRPQVHLVHRRRTPAGRVDPRRRGESRAIELSEFLGLVAEAEEVYRRWPSVWRRYGTEHALDPLHGILRTRYPELAETERALQSLRTEVETHRRSDGSWAALDDLDGTAREHLDAALDRALELLAPVAAICQPRRTS